MLPLVPQRKVACHRLGQCLVRLHRSKFNLVEMDAQVLDRVRSQLSKVKVPSSYSRVYKDECMFSFATPESEGGIFVNLESWYGVGSRFLALEHERSGNVLYFNEKHHRVPLKEDEVKPEGAPTKLAIGGDDGFQVDKKKYGIDKETALVIMPERTVIPLPCPELPELVLNAIAGIEVRPWPEFAPLEFDQPSNKSEFHASIPCASHQEFIKRPTCAYPGMIAGE